ncbi:hypothetical protein HYU21_02850 [Candidatus Woesearchaeota archaeon]|nr:hypothetical protein [Candidatus Woesearchaeota archaeon]
MTPKLKKLLIIDTSSLLSAVEWKIDLFSLLDDVCDFSYQTAVLQASLDELERIKSTADGKEKAAAKLVLAILINKLKTKEIIVLPEKGYVDDLLLEKSKQRALILTQDILLKKKLIKPYLTIRQKKVLLMVR